MPDEPRHSTRSAGAHGWFRVASVCLLLTFIPTAAYVFIYRESRLANATVRNFRALDAASQRVNSVLENLPTIVGSAAFGLSPAMVREVAERLNRPGPTRRVGCEADAAAYEPADRQRPGSLPDGLDAFGPQTAPTPEARQEFAYRLAVRLLQQGDGEARDFWNELLCLIEKHREHSAKIETIEVDVTPLRRMPANLTSAHCGRRTDSDCVERLRGFLTSHGDACHDRSRLGSLAIDAGRDGMVAVVDDCRPLRERHRGLFDALSSRPAQEDAARRRGEPAAVVQALDLFGVRSTAKLDQLMSEATGFLSGFFDDHLIADRSGRILFQAESPATPRLRSDENRSATPAFSSHVHILDLLRGDPPADRILGFGAGAGSAPAGDGTSSPSMPGQSFVTTADVGGVELRIFVQPFLTGNIAAGGDAPPPGDAASSARGSTRSAFYVVGITDENEFQSAAIRLRLKWVVNATLAVIVILTLCPMLWIRTAGDRLFVGPQMLAVFSIGSVIGIVVCVVLAYGVVTNGVDERALDDGLEEVAKRLTRLFNAELDEDLGALDEEFQEASASRPGAECAGSRPERAARESCGEPLNALERTFYCDTGDRLLGREAPTIENSFLMNERGTQVRCGGNQLTRNPRLELGFREYFRRPRDQRVWTTKYKYRKETRIDPSSAMTEILDGSGGRRKAEPPERKARYFLERIDSIVRGDVQTVLAMPAPGAKGGEESGTPESKVGATSVHFVSLEYAALPPHVDFAVMDGRTGETLFHSERSLAMATNFNDDVDRDPELRSLVQSKTADTIGLVYYGVPIRAHARPLRTGMPWTLIVYRSHDVEDRLTTVTTALALFSTLLPLMLAAGLFIVRVWVAAQRGTTGEATTAADVVARVAAFRPAWWAGAGIGVLLLAASWLPAAGGSGLLAWCAVIWMSGVGAFLAKVAAGRDGAADSRHGGTPTTRRRAVLCAAVLGGLAVAPAGLWFGHHRAQLVAGLERYFEHRVCEATEQAREEYALYELKHHGRERTPDDEPGRCDPAAGNAGGPRRPANGMFDALRPLVASSALASDLMLYRALPPEAGGRATGLRGVLRDTFEYDGGPGSGTPAWPFWLALAGAGLAGLAVVVVVCAVAYCVVVVTIGRVELQTSSPTAGKLLSDWRAKPGADDSPFRIIVTHAGDSGRRDFERKLESERRLRVRRIAWRDEAGKQGPTWAPEQGGAASVHVFDDLEVLLRPGERNDFLLAELERLIEEEGASVLIWSRIKPHYRYTRRFRATERWPAGRSEEGLARWDRLQRIVCRCDSCLLDEEVRPNAGSSTAIWLDSTVDERLQLYALACGGVSRSGRASARTSLRDRGVVENVNGGVSRLRIPGFSAFVRSRVDQEELAAWRRGGDGGSWRIIWPPVGVGAVLALLFLAQANPEMVSTLVTAFCAIVPIALPLFRGGGSAGDST